MRNDYPTGTTAVNVTVKGNVTGVGFREYVREAAWESGLVGHIKFTTGGASAFIQGDPSGAESLLSKIRRAPLAVSEVRVRHARVRPRERGFRIIPSGLGEEFREGFETCVSSMRGEDLRSLA